MRFAWIALLATLFGALTACSAIGGGSEKFEFTGYGAGATDPFTAKKGTYLVTWSCNSSSTYYPAFKIQEIASAGFFYISIRPDGTNPSEKVMPVHSDTRVIGQTDCAGNWKLTAEPVK